MQQRVVTRGFSACPHDCPSTCALEIELPGNNRIGRVHGARDNTYTDGVVCAKVARYAERAHHPDRLMHPLRRVGAKGSKRFERIGWDDALGLVAEAFSKAERTLGAEAVWPYYYAGTMGLVQRDSINRLRNVKGYSQQYSTICTTLAYTGYIAGTGRIAGPDPREMAKSDCVVIWGTNPVNTQVNVMTHAVKARKERGAKIVAIDIYRNGTMEQADMALCVKPGTDAALACAVMHVLFRDGYANWPYLERYTDCPRDLERHLSTKTPAWAAEITGLGVSEIEAFAKLVGTTPRTFFRLGFGFARQRNGSANMHAASCIAAVTGAWLHEGGGCFFNNSAIYHWNKEMIEANRAIDPEVRQIDMSRIGDALIGNPYDLAGGPPVTAMLVQNCNPIQVAPEQRKVKAGFARDDFFVAVHEQFMTATAELADVVIPATMFTEHDDIYQASGHQHITLGPKLVDAPGECRSNHDVIQSLAKLVGAEHEGFGMSERELIDWTLQNSGWGTLAEIERSKWIDCQPDFETAHYLKGFAYPDGKFRFRPDWDNVPAPRRAAFGLGNGHMPALPDYWAVNEAVDDAHPFRMATSPARNYLNSSFNETPTSAKREGRPRAKMHPDDMARLGLADGQKIRMGNERGEIGLWVEGFDGVQRGVVIVESIAPNHLFEDGEGINTLTSAMQGAPYGGAAFHDNHVWIKPAPAEGATS